ncbi:MAG: hypothetical protein OSB65_04000 [Roseibacillus sp.]|nr:hypothetical protein [Roseibacillus sp.]
MHHSSCCALLAPTTRHLTALYASLAGDALCLGPHWIYNQAKIARTYPEAFPGTLHYALRFSNDLLAALSQNALATGDNFSHRIRCSHHRRLASRIV